MRRAPVLLAVAALSLACTAPLHTIGEGEGEGSLPIGGGEGEGEGVVGEGEGEGVVGEGEGEGVVGEGEGEGEGACDFTVAGDPEKARVVLVGHTFTDDPNTDGTEIRSLTLTGETLVDNGARLDVHAPPARIAFEPSGDLAIVLGSNGHITSVRVNGASSLTIAHEMDLPATADYRDIRLSADGRRAFVVGFNSQITDGVRVVDVDCDGELAEETASFYSSRLAIGLAPLANDRAFYVGGQVIGFTPTDPNDVRVLSLSPSVTEVHAFDFSSDSVDCTRVAASADGSRAAVPNSALGSAEAGDVALYGIAGDVVTELDRAPGFTDAAEALFSPDGRTLLVSQVEPNRVAVFDVSAGTLVEGQSVTGVGLAEQMALVGRGAESGLVLVAATNANGNIHMLRIGSAGQSTDLGSLDLGAAFNDIPGAIAVQP